MPKHKNNICSQKLREIERLGAVHVGYGDDQCVRCGGIRVAGSTLCEDCLVKSLNNCRPALHIAEGRKKELEEEKRELMELVEKLLDHISSEAVYTAELRLELWKAKGIVAG